MQAKVVPFTGDPWKVVPASSVRLLSQRELDETFGDDSTTTTEGDDDDDDNQEERTAILLTGSDALLDDDNDNDAASYASSSPAASPSVHVSGVSGGSSGRGRAEDSGRTPLDTRRPSSVGLSPAHGDDDDDDGDDGLPTSPLSDASDSSFSVGVPGSPCVSIA